MAKGDAHINVTISLADNKKLLSYIKACKTLKNPNEENILINEIFLKGLASEEVQATIQEAEAVKAEKKAKAEKAKAEKNAKALEKALKAKADAEAMIAKLTAEAE